MFRLAVVVLMLGAPPAFLIGLAGVGCRRPTAVAPSGAAIADATPAARLPRRARHFLKSTRIASRFSLGRARSGSSASDT